MDDLKKRRLQLLALRIHRALSASEEVMSIVREMKEREMLGACEQIMFRTTIAAPDYCFDMPEFDIMIDTECDVEWSFAEAASPAQTVAFA